MAKTRNFRKVGIAVGIGLLLAFSGASVPEGVPFSETAWAQEQPQSQAQPQPQPEVEGPITSSQGDENGQNQRSAGRKTKARRGGEKETEGTNALNRFEVDTVIKSQYRLNGEHLEVDPD